MVYKKKKKKKKKKTTFFFLHRTPAIVETINVMVLMFFLSGCFSWRCYLSQMSQCDCEWSFLSPGVWVFYLQLQKPWEFPKRVSGQETDSLKSRRGTPERAWTLESDKPRTKTQGHYLTSCVIVSLGDLLSTAEPLQMPQCPYLSLW
jgi:hypothetical protein